MRQKFIHKDHLKRANAEVINQIMNHREKNVWGEATTACASDSKHFGTGIENLHVCILKLNLVYRLK